MFVWVRAYECIISFPLRFEFFIDADRIAGNPRLSCSVRRRYPTAVRAGARGV